MRKMFALLIVVVMSTAGLAQATPIPVIEEPVLRSDSLWEQTAWGYKLKSLSFPASDGYDWPTMMTMEGYSGASRPMPNAYLRMDDGELMALRFTFGQGPRGDYLMLQASTRGTECSGGSFNLYDRRHAWDGYHIIEWVAAQPWSNEAVGMFGSSFPGQTAYWVAATQPPHLKAISANLLHSDIYRDIFMPGGVQNYLFPTAWTYAAGPHRLPQDSVQRQDFRDGKDEICAQNQATRYSVGDVPQAQNEPAWAALRSVDDQWYTAHAALTYAPMIKIPYYMQNNWQDEQVGPRSAVLWHHINPDPQTIIGKDGQPRTVIPKKMVLANGDHGHGNFAGRDRWNWMDIWLLGRPDVAGLLDSPVVNYFETDNNGNAKAVKSGPAWPFPDTDWTNVYLGADGTIDLDAADAAAGERSYLTGVSRQNYFIYADETAPGDAMDTVAGAEGLPEQLEYRSEALADDLAIAGPIQMDLTASLAGTDADFFVSISDQWPDGSVSYLQRGLLKASHRRVDPERSYYADASRTRMVQPYRPHTNPQPVVPGEVNTYRIEIFPLGHVFRAGHKIVVKIHTPPITDGIWGYTPTHHQPAAVTVQHGGLTSIQLPVVRTDAPALPATSCRVPAGFPCYAAPTRIP